MLETCYPFHCVVISLFRLTAILAAHCFILVLHDQCCMASTRQKFIALITTAGLCLKCALFSNWQARCSLALVPLVVKACEQMSLMYNDASEWVLSRSNY